MGLKMCLSSKILNVAASGLGFTEDHTCNHRWSSTGWSRSSIVNEENGDLIH